MGNCSQQVHANLQTCNPLSCDCDVIAAHRIAPGVIAEPNATAWQRFLPTGPLALLPARDGYSNIVWSTSPAMAAALEAMAPHEFAAAVNKVGQGIGVAAGDLVLGTWAHWPPAVGYACSAHHSALAQAFACARLLAGTLTSFRVWWCSCPLPSPTYLRQTRAGAVRPSYQLRAQRGGTAA